MPIYNEKRKEIGFKQTKLLNLILDNGQQVSKLFDKLFYSHNFGHNGPLDFHGLGINAKISELQAAMGLSVLPFMEEILNGNPIKFILNFE